MNKYHISQALLTIRSLRRKSQETHPRSFALLWRLPRLAQMPYCSIVLSLLHARRSTEAQLPFRLLTAPYLLHLKDCLSTLHPTAHCLHSIPLGILADQ